MGPLTGDETEQQQAIDLLLRMHEAVEEAGSTFSPGVEWFRFLSKFRNAAINDHMYHVTPSPLRVLIDKALEGLGIDPKEVEARPVRDDNAWVIHCRELLRAAHPREDHVVESYIQEAEHQDGYEYWTNFAPWTFEGIKALMEDFALYLDNYY